MALAFCIGNTYDFFAVASATYVAEVNFIRYQSYEEAWTAAKESGTITMLDNRSISGVLTVDENTIVTVNMNSFMINRGLNSPKSSGQVFLVKPPMPF